MLKQTEMTREEIVTYLKLNLMSDRECNHFSEDYINGTNNIIEHLIDVFSDSNLAYNTDTGYFDYIGDLLPP